VETPKEKEISQTDRTLPKDRIHFVFRSDFLSDFK